MTPGDGPVVVLVGPPGAAVAEVARRVGELLGLPVRDTDDDVERLAGCSVADVFVEHGESAFREWERTAVVAALAEHRGVLALGGGAVTDPSTERDLAGRRVVFLDVGLAEAARRLGLSRERPAGLGSPRAQWSALMERRRPVYRRVAGAVVATDGRGVDEIAAAVCELLPPAAGAGPGRADEREDEREDEG